MAGPLPPASLALPPGPELEAWAASIYRRLAGSPAADLALDPKYPTVPVILHPSAPRGGTAPPVTARHLGFLRVDLAGETAGPGRFFPLFPAGANLALRPAWLAARALASLPDPSPTLPC